MTNLRRSIVPIFGLWIAIMFGFSVLFICNIIDQTMFVGMIGPIIAIGPPALYHYYIERVKRPDIRFGDISYEIRPMYINANFSPDIDDIDQISLPHVARPAVFLTAEVTNLGRATAQNCKVIVENGSEYSARWSMVNNPEKYDLLPGESEDIHLAKLFLTNDFFFLRGNWFDDLNHVLKTLFRLEHSHPQTIIETKFGSSVISPAGNPQGIVQTTSSDTQLVSSEHIEMGIFYPAEQPPERQNQSIRGGWWGDRQSSGQKSFRVRGLAEDHKTSVEYLGDHDLPHGVVHSILKQDDIVRWSEEWTDRDYSEFKNDLISALADWRKK